LPRLSLLAGALSAFGASKRRKTFLRWRGADIGVDRLLPVTWTGNARPVDVRSSMPAPPLTAPLLLYRSDQVHEPSLHLPSLPLVERERYYVHTALFAIRLFPSSETEQVGMMSFIPAGAIVEVSGPWNLASGIVEVTYERQRYAVLELKLDTRASPVQSEAVRE
jgi:hypothetical protein